IGYTELAEGIKAGCGFAALSRSGKCGPAEIERTPGYPLFLAVSSGPRVAVAIQAVLGAGTAVLVGLFAWRQWGIAAGLIAEFIVAFDVSSLMVGSQLLSEILFTFVVTLATLLETVLVYRKSVDLQTVAGLTGAGLLFAIAALLRPVGQVLSIVPALGTMGLSKIS